jgi:hypothetical protein
VLAVLLMGGTGKSPACASNADVDCSGGTNAFDALILLRYVAGLSANFSGCTPIGVENV